MLVSASAGIKDTHIIASFFLWVLRTRTQALSSYHLSLLWARHSLYDLDTAIVGEFIQDTKCISTLSHPVLGTL